MVKISSVIEEIYGDKLHQKRKLYLANATMGVLVSESLFLHRMAERLVDTRGGSKKLATKQIHRLLSNQGISIWDLSAPWIPYVLSGEREIILALDWRSFFDDEQKALMENFDYLHMGSTFRPKFFEVEK